MDNYIILMSDYPITLISLSTHFLGWMGHTILLVVEGGVAQNDFDFLGRVVVTFFRLVINVLRV